MSKGRPEAGECRQGGSPVGEHSRLAMCTPLRTTHSRGAQLDRCRGGASWIRQLVLFVALVGVGAILLSVAGDVPSLILRRGKVLIALGGIACWRWAWFVVQNLRALAYRYGVFPRLRRQAERAVARSGPVPEVTILATTYHEKPWITETVFDSILRE